MDAHLVFAVLVLFVRVGHQAKENAVLRRGQTVLCCTRGESNIRLGAPHYSEAHSSKDWEAGEEAGEGAGVY